MLNILLNTFRISIKYLLLVFVISFIVACTSIADNSGEVNSQTPSSEAIQEHKFKGIQAILHLKDSVFESSMDAYVEATILNHDSTVFSIRQYVIQQAILSLLVKDVAGQIVPSIPPSTPPIDMDKDLIHIKPGEAYMMTYDLHIFSPLLASGSYQVSMKNIPSNTVTFRIE